MATEVLDAQLGGAEGLKGGDELHAGCVVLQSQRCKCAENQDSGVGYIL